MVLVGSQSHRRALQMVSEAVLTAAVAPSGEAAPPAVGSDQPSLPTPRPHSPTFEGLDLEQVVGLLRCLLWGTKLGEDSQRIGLKVCVLPNSYVEILMPRAMC